MEGLSPAYDGIICAGQTQRECPSNTVYCDRIIVLWLMVVAVVVILDTVLAIVFWLLFYRKGLAALTHTACLCINFLTGGICGDGGLLML